ncbi:MAG: adenylate/guanylate cyclase domain-containing protein [Herminiimonas sp.]|nr:adenylate/guanylate cyclase domain-containing protein [Herminiimonas sp.]
MRKQVLRYGVALLLLAVMLAHVTQRLPLPMVAAFDRLIYDIRLRLTMPGTIDPRIAIIDIDEKSLAEIGRWPWRRDRMARLTTRAFDDYGARIMGFDLVMAEADDSSGLGTLDKLGANELRDDAGYRAALAGLRATLDYDSLFAAALKGRPAILGYYLANEGSTSGALPAPALPAAALGGHDIAITNWRNHGGNLQQLQDAAADAGSFNPIIDPDGSVRRVPLLAFHAGQYYAAFSLAMVRAYLGAASVQPVFAEGDLDALRLQAPGSAALLVPVDENVAAWVPYRGGERSFPYYSAADLIAGRLPPDALRGKIVIVGTTAPGLRDLRTTPVGEIYPGMEVHANLISGMLEHRIKERPGYGMAIEFCAVLLIGLVMVFLFPWQAPFAASAATLLLACALVGGNLALWQYLNWIVPLATGLMVIALVYVWNMAYGYFIESRDKRRITQRFGQYVPPELVDKMVLDPGRYSMDSRKAELTVLFSDVRGFTTISEGLEPDALAKYMNQYLTRMTLVIRRHGGTLDKYIGDAIVAFWGAPVDDAQHAAHAVAAALDMQAELQLLNGELLAQGWPAMKIGIGINTGSMTVGDMGSSIRLAYTVMGDAVNLGARLESKTKEYGVDIMVGETTRAATPAIAYRELDCVQVKGKEMVVTVYEPLGAQSTLTPAVVASLAVWETTLSYYRRQEWAEAQAGLQQLTSDAANTQLLALYAQRIAAFQHTPPPPGWRGVTRFDAK